MSDLLFSLIDNMDRPLIVSENHSLNSIHIEESAITSGIASGAGVSVWDASEYGISADVARQMIADADTPEARERVMASLRQRAIARLGADTSNGRVNIFTAGKLPWHKLGVNIQSANDSGNAMILSGTNHKYEKIPMSYTLPDGRTVQADDTYAIVRLDTGEKVGQCGKVYKVIQNSDGFAFLDTVLAEFGAKYESAGSLFGGRQAWCLARLPEQSFTLGSKDVNNCYAMFTLDHTGSGADYCFPTSERVECANTLRLAMAGRRGKGISIRHTGDIRGKVKDAQQALGLSIRNFGQYKEAAEVMYRTPLEPREYVNLVLDRTTELTAEQVKQGAMAIAKELGDDTERGYKSAQRAIDKRASIFDDIMSRYDSPTCEPRGTAWSAFNAVTETADHGRLGKMKEADKESRQFESVMVGQADDMKQEAYSLALASI